MAEKRKKWTPAEEVTDAVLKFREKRKWQLALRRYVLERNISHAYAPYFGLDIESYRQWIELQFTDELNWENFGSAWQFDHIVPIAYFDFGNEEDLRLCWNFINIRIERLEEGKAGEARINILAARSYFESLFSKTKYTPCLKMVKKIDGIAFVNTVSEPRLEDFIKNNLQDLIKLSSLDADDYNRINKGMSLKDLLTEKEILSRFG